MRKMKTLTLVYNNEEFVYTSTASRVERCLKKLKRAVQAIQAKDPRVKMCLDDNGFVAECQNK